MAANRSTVYLDVDDDITAIIGKLSDAEHKSVALVVPKRSAVLQSVVNMKLVKKAADNNSKQPVLITDDPLIKNIASGQSMLVAANLQAEPAVPEAVSAGVGSLPSDVIEGESVTPAAGAVVTPSNQTDKVAAAAPVAPIVPPKTPKSDKKRLPDFDNFKKRFLLVILGISGLGFLIWLLLFLLPKATIMVEGRTEPLPISLGFTADHQVERPEYDNSLLPADYQETTKTLSKTITPTGRRDVGSKATGTLSIRNCEDTSPRSLSAGSNFTASNGRVFISDQAVTVPEGKFSGGGSQCNSDTASVPVSARENGESYNIGPTSYSNSDLDGNFIITGSQMSGGSSKTVTVVTKTDVDNAQNELVSNERGGIKKELANQFKDDDLVLAAGYGEEVIRTTSDPGVDQEASTARVVVEVKYSQLGVKKEHLDELVKRRGNQQKGDDKRGLAVVDSGIAAADIKLKDKTAATAYRFDLSTRAALGPDINFDELKNRIAGKRFGETVEIVKSYPNVSGADVKFSPFYVRKVPANPDKVIIEIKLPNQ